MEALREETEALLRIHEATKKLSSIKDVVEHASPIKVELNFSFPAENGSGVVIELDDEASVRKLYYELDAILDGRKSVMAKELADYLKMNA